MGTVAGRWCKSVSVDHVIRRHHQGGLSNADLLFRLGQSRAAMATQDVFADIEVRHSIPHGLEGL